MSRGTRERRERWAPGWLACAMVAVLAAPSQAADSKPQVTVLSPVDNAENSAEQVLLRLSVALAEGEELQVVRAYVDGRLAAQARGLKLVDPAGVSAGGSRTREQLLTISVPPQACTIGVLAETNRGKSELTTIALRYKAAAKPAPLLPPKLYALLVGVSKYRIADIRLRYAAKDAQDLAAVLVAQRRVLYQEVQARVLVDEKATRDGILDGLEWLQRQTTAKDVAILFLAGHGITDPSTGAYYFLPYDADRDAIKRSMVPENEVRNTLTSIKGKALLFLDTCHAGKVYGDTQTRALTDLSPLISELASAENGVVVFAASTGRQSSLEAPEWNNGAFTKAVVEGLRGRADVKKSGRVTLTMLDYYISERVKELTQGRQTPTTAKPSTVPDFPLSAVQDLRDEDVDPLR